MVGAGSQPTAELRIVNPGTLEPQVGVPYRFQLAATGGDPPYTWELGAGEPLARGLVLDPDGWLHGTAEERIIQEIYDLIVTDSAGKRETTRFNLVVSLRPMRTPLVYQLRGLRAAIDLSGQAAYQALRIVGVVIAAAILTYLDNWWQGGVGTFVLTLAVVWLIVKVRRLEANIAATETPPVQQQEATQPEDTVGSPAI